MLVTDMLVTGTQPILIGIHVGLHITFSFVAHVSFHDQQFDTTRSYAALWAADLDWIVGPGYSLGRVHSGEKP